MTERDAAEKLSHDLRQPLAAIKTWTDLLASSLGDQATEKQSRYLAKVHAEIGRMAGLLDGLTESGADRSSGTDDDG